MGAEFNYKIPEGLEIQAYRDYIDTLPVVDSPNIFGLHTNADLTYRQIEASMMIATIMNTQPGIPIKFPCPIFPCNIVTSCETIRMWERVQSTPHLLCSNVESSSTVIFVTIRQCSINFSA